MLSWWGKIFYVVAASLIRSCARIYFPLKPERLESVPRSGGLLIASNHVSHLDPPLLGVSIPRINFMMAKKELFKVKFLEWFMLSVGTILVDRASGKQALEEAISRLKQGACIVVFPEGTRSKTGRLMRGKAGIVLMAIHTGSPIQPTAIIGSEKAMTKGTKGIKSVPIKVVFGKPYNIDYEGDPFNVPKDTLRRECYRLMQAINDLLPEQMKMDPEDEQKWYGRLKDPVMTDAGNEPTTGQTAEKN